MIFSVVYPNRTVFECDIEFVAADKLLFVRYRTAYIIPQPASGVHLFVFGKQAEKTFPYRVGHLGIGYDHAAKLL